MRRIRAATAVQDVGTAAAGKRVASPSAHKPVGAIVAIEAIEKARADEILDA